ncbi:MAG: FIST C-terminal domain-containing protein [Desulfobacterales bacterium]|nr:FIST C-terminal domain-containing protein [Desulfobacterales bacterium]
MCNKNIEIGYGISKEESSFSAGLEAAKQAASAIITNAISVVVVFASVKYNLIELIKGVKESAGNCQLIGTTTAGEICNGMHQKSVVVVIIASPYIKVHVGLGENVSKNLENAISQATRGISAFFTLDDNKIWEKLMLEGSSALSILFSPGNTKYSNSKSYNILEELKRLSMSKMPIFGGSSADDWKMEKNYVLFDNACYEDSILISVFEISLKFGTAFSHGFIPTNNRAVATRVEENEVIELDGKPADEVYSKLIGSSKEELINKHLTFTSGKPAGIRDPYGQYSINIASFFTQRGGVKFSQPIPEDSVLTIMKAEPYNLIFAGREALRKAALRGDISNNIAVIFVFSCALRYGILKNKVEEEITSIKNMFTDAPVVGFYSFGEQGLADDGINRHNNGVITILVISKELSYSANVSVQNKILQKKLEETIENYRISEEKLKKLQAELEYTVCERNAELSCITDKLFREFKARTRLEAEMEQINKMHSLGILARGISHDFNNLLNIIIGNAQLALKEIRKFTMAYDSINAIISAGKKAGEITRQVLTFSSKDGEKLFPTSFISNVNDSLKLIKMNCKSNIKIIQENLCKNDIVMAAQGSINQIILNLCTNALDAMKDHGGILRVNISNEEIQNKLYVRLSISDTGIGISPEIKDQIFDPYFTTKEEGKGTGFGLSIVSGIIKKLSGLISFNSEEGKGTEFIIHLPVHNVYNESK